MKTKLLAASSAALLFALPFLTACAAAPVAVAPSTTPITAVDVVTQIGSARGKACGVYLMGFLPIVPGNHLLDRAISDAVKPTGADALVDVTAEANAYFFFFVTANCATVYGKAVKIIKGAKEH